MITKKMKNLVKNLTEEEKEQLLSLIQKALESLEKGTK